MKKEKPEFVAIWGCKKDSRGPLESQAWLRGPWQGGSVTRQLPLSSMEGHVQLAEKQHPQPPHSALSWKSLSPAGTPQAARRWGGGGKRDSLALISLLGLLPKSP